MRQFVRKNRKKRKYIRHIKVEKKMVKKVEKKPVKITVKKPTLNKKVFSHFNLNTIRLPALSLPLRRFIKFLGSICIISFVLITIYFILKNISYTASTIFAPKIEIPQDAIKNNIIDFFALMGKGITSIIDVIGNFLMSILWVIIQIWNGIIGILSGIYNGFVILIAFIITVLTKLFSALMTFFNVLYILLVQFLSFIWYTIVVTTTFIVNWITIVWHWISIQTERFFYWLGTPFRILGVFFDMMKPYLMILGHHIQGAFDVLRDGFKTLTSIGSMK